MWSNIKAALFAVAITAVSCLALLWLSAHALADTNLVSDVGNPPRPTPRTEKPGRPIKVYVIDTGLNLADARFSSHLCKMGHKDFTGTGINDVNGHGTAVVGLIERFAGSAETKDYCIVVYKYFIAKDTNGNTARLREAVAWAAAAAPEVVNISSAGPGPLDSERLAIAKAKNTVFVVAAGNFGKETKTYPAAYDLINVVSVGALGPDGKSKSDFSNYGDWVKAWLPGENILVDKIGGGYYRADGTSFACAQYTGGVIKRLVGK